MERILITGANRGVGLELTKQYIKAGHVHIIATCRNPDTASELNNLAQQYPNHLDVVKLDINDSASIEQSIYDIEGAVASLDVLINNAGIKPGSQADSRLGTLESSEMQQVITTNAIAPLLVTQAYLHLLKKGNNPRVVMVSSQMGSMDWTKSGGSYAYRMSKAAMNMAARTLASDGGMSGITVVTTHPGWVRTDMGGSGADISPQESAAGLIKVIQKLDQSDNGKFYKWNGEEHRW